MLIGIEAERANAPQKTGVEHYAQQLILQFANLSQKGSSFLGKKDDPLDMRFVLYLRTEPEEWIKKLPKNFSYKVMPFPIFWTQLRLSWEMLWHKPDALFVPASAIPLISPKKTVCTIHDSAFLFYPETFTPFMRKFLHYSYKFISWKAWKIVVPSKASKDDLVKYYHTDPSKIQVIHHGYTPQSGKHEILSTKSETNSNNKNLQTDHISHSVIPEATSKSSSEGYLESSTNIDSGSQITRPLKPAEHVGQEFGMTESQAISSNLTLSPSPRIGEGELSFNQNKNDNKSVIPDATSKSTNAGNLESSRDADTGSHSSLSLRAHPSESKTYNLPARYVLFLSTLQPRKNLEGLIDAIKLFRTQNPKEDVKLVVAGRVGWKAENILKKIEANKEFVLYLNHVTNEERAELYQKAEVFCVPSFYEGFGMWILEAFDAGVPVITSSISSMPEVGGEAVEYCDPHKVESIAKALENVLLDPQRKTQLKELGFERLKQFSWEKCGRETLGVLLT